MRIITGLARGCKLKTPKGMETRPTADRIKESLFNILGGAVREQQVLDVFAGTGNLGLEALSRGAAAAVFVDQSMESVRIIKENSLHTHLDDKTEIVKSDVFAALQRMARSGRKFSLVFCDPPYNKNLCQKTLLFLDGADLLEEGALVIMEHAREDDLQLALKNLQVVRNQTYGSTTQISIFRWMPEEAQKEEKK